MDYELLLFSCFWSTVSISANSRLFLNFLGVGSSDTLCGVPDLPGGCRLGLKLPGQNMQLRIMAKASVLCCHLVNEIEERFHLLPNYIGPCRSDTVYGPVSETVKICLGKVLKKSLFLSLTKEGEPCYKELYIFISF